MTAPRPLEELVAAFAAEFPGLPEAVYAKAREYFTAAAEQQRRQALAQPFCRHFARDPYDEDHD